jgi:hypothetical protein
MKQYMIGIWFILILAGCSPETTITPKTISGNVSDTTLGAATLEAYLFDENGEDIANVGKGTLNADGSFSITLEEPDSFYLLDYATVSQGFPMCDDGVISNETIKAAPVTLYIVKNGVRVRPITQINSGGDKIASYIYINQDVEGQGDCSWLVPSKLENAQLKKGWNQVLLDLSAGSSVTITTPKAINLPWN